MSLSASKASQDGPASTAAIHFGSSSKLRRVGLWLGLCTLLALSPAIAARLHADPAALLIQSAEATLASGDYLAGVDLYTRAVHHSKKNPALYLEFAMFCERAVYAADETQPELKQTLFERMIGAYREASAQFPEDGYLAASYAAACTMTGHLNIPMDVEEAIGAWLHLLDLREKALAVWPYEAREMDLVMPLLHLGRLALRTDNLDLAQTYFSRVATITPHSPVLLLLLAQLEAAESNTATVHLAGS